ncbi:unnamed protein product [Adineta ricciae]|uniref:cellulase n=1 Tax=Adineta ricciae TaxID=249248 RepID=A0A813QXY3_ADIRI|nr:unnamed protein product [Adineta ricciae]CAF1276405.1 unnamed protein product [Adineta ricciae]
MIRLVYLSFLLHAWLNTCYTTYINYIESAEYVPANLSNVLLYTGSCSDCICQAFFSDNSSKYEVINCYTINHTCLLFPQFVSTSIIRINTNSKLISRQTLFNTTASCSNIYGQCGGGGWNGTTNCCSGLTCTYQNASYSQCLSIVVTTSQSPITATYYDDGRQNASTSIYWDCCKLSCGWPYKASVTNPARTCAQDGITTIDSNTQSYCNGGSSYLCIDQQPWNVSSTLSYGYAGGFIAGHSEWDWCCACYSLLFTSGAIAGKELIVQVVNTAYTSGNMFVLQVPGGGWGGSSNGCANQFSSNYSWGNQYGGFTDRANCSQLPSFLQAGCYWRFDWFMNAYYPTARFKAVTCPTALTAITGCVRQ